MYQWIRRLRADHQLVRYSEKPTILLHFRKSGQFQWEKNICWLHFRGDQKITQLRNEVHCPLTQNTSPWKEESPSGFSALKEAKWAFEPSIQETSREVLGTCRHFEKVDVWMDGCLCADWFQQKIQTTVAEFTSNLQCVSWRKDKNTILSYFCLLVFFLYEW